MARTLLNATVIGHVGSVRQSETKKGTSILNLRVAHNRRYQDEEETEWVDVTLFGKLAESVESYIDKGTLIYASGDAQTRTWVNGDGETEANLSIGVREFSILSSREDRGEKTDDRRGKSRPRPAGKTRSRQRDVFEEDDGDTW